MGPSRLNDATGLTLLIDWICRQILNLNHVFSKHDAAQSAVPARSWKVGGRPKCVRQCRGTAHSDGVKKLTVIRVDDAEGGVTQPHRLFEHCFEDRREVAWRGVDDLQYFGGGRL